MAEGWTLSDLQRLREEMEMTQRFRLIEHAERMRLKLGDDVYRHMRGEGE